LKTGRMTFSPVMETATRYNRWIVEAFAEALQGTILEVGFGHQGLRPLLPRGVNYIGIDVDEEVVREARCGLPEWQVVQADISDTSLPQLLAGTRVDTVLCVNVLEHVADDRAAIINLLSCLQPGGQLCLFVPAFSGLYNDLDRLAGHLRRYRTGDVEALVPEGLGRMARVEYFNPVGGLGWWLNGLLRHEELSARAVRHQVQVFDRLILPVSRALNPLTRRVFGQSVLAIVERM